ncbi:alcohol dehydrogenase catalytic domain-containing protein [Lentzea flaviverrucosa]|uniref:NADPH:quinone reductase n=1 Tax=Lentzea flaviverrucosa TaxID=200379 RepID=A0A1H9BT65_9PSEU|nr:zinc-binding dehydrogenase [Lentzea flaviverrucosa]RDI31695.1 NADPH:quinone reductase-like Zn-dependent oxidoreductase [Lentzea flaviverrucosa]SEP91578.1 NADPH:quinone reductase [Lentzea flaviverrucosa]
MRTITYEQQGPAAQVLRLQERPAPAAPTAGQVLVRVLARPVHPGDLAGVEGFPGLPQQRFATPQVPGLEGTGVVEALGEGVPGLVSGQRVAFFPVPGAWSELVTVPAELVVPVPHAVSAETAAVLLVNPITLLTLLRAVEDAGKGQPGPVVQTAAGSSIGKLVSAAALRHGFPLVNLVRSAAGARELRQRFPALPAISTSDADWRTQVRDAVGGSGAQVVLYAVGGSLTGDLTALLADGGTLISYGALGSGGTVLESLAPAPRELTVRGVSVGRWLLTRTPAERAEDVAFAIDLAETAPELFEVAGRYDLADFAEAVDHVRRPGKSGTVLLTGPAS